MAQQYNKTSSPLSACSSCSMLFGEGLLANGESDLVLDSRGVVIAPGELSLRILTEGPKH